MALNRRNFLLGLGLGLGASALDISGRKFSLPFAEAGMAQNPNALSFTPVRVPLPLEFQNLSPDKQRQAYSSYEVVDQVVLPEGFTYDVIAAWGDRVGNSRFGYNNDYLSLVETKPNEGFLTVNFEYISGKVWMDSFAEVIGKNLPIEEVRAALKDEKGAIDAYSLPADSPLKAQILAIVEEGLTDLGLGVISIRRTESGKWERTYSSADRRISGISGYKDGNYLQATGPGVKVFEKSDKMGYDDGLGAKIIGTFQNCAGGTTPWGTVFSAEENFQDQVFEPVKADGSSFAPEFRTFELTETSLEGQGNALGLAGNKYGWMVEIDPSNPQDYGKKHTWLGRFRHEAVAFKAETGKPLAVYSGCDRRSGHLYKFISRGKIQNLSTKDNSRLLEEGMLYGAKFNADGTGQWIALSPDTPVNPVLPSQIVPREGKGIVFLPNPNRLEGGIQEYNDDALIAEYKEQFKTLGDLYTGNRSEKQGAILIDAHYAATAAGVTCTGRPEDTIVSPEGILYIAFTSGTPGPDGGPDRRIFAGPGGKIPYEFGWVMALKEDKNAPEALSFTWEMFATGGEPAAQGLGFANPDNLEFDNNGNLWMVTDMSTAVQNKEVASRTPKGEPISQTSLLGIFGNNTAWFLPTSGPNVGQAYPFAIGPMDTEMTGPWFSADAQTLFLAVQHPGEANGIRQDMRSEMRSYVLKTTQGQEFVQQRRVPIGSNWPGGQVNQAPRPAVIAVRRAKAGAITA